MRFKCNKSSNKYRRNESRVSLLKEWHREFAWWPVVVDGEQCVWLESIEAKYPDAWVGYSGTLYYEVGKYRFV